MSEFEEKLNALLSDPEEMAKITRLASELMGGEQTAAKEHPPAPDAEAFGALGRMLGGAGLKNDCGALVAALLPYLRPERQAKLKKAVRMAQMARIAEKAISEYGGDGGV